MKKIIGDQHLRISASSLGEYDGQKMTVSGAVHKIRGFGGLRFIIIRDGQFLIQCKLESSSSNVPAENYAEGNYVSVTGVCRKEPRAPHGAEIEIETINVLSRPAAEMPFSVNQKLFEVGIDNNLNFRPISLRHPKQRAIFAIQSAISMLFRKGFARSGSPKSTLLNSFLRVRKVVPMCSVWNTSTGSFSSPSLRSSTSR